MTAPPNSSVDNGDESQIPDWVLSYSRFLKHVPLVREYNWPYFHVLNRWTVEAVRVDLTGLGMIPIYTLNRRSQHIKRGDESYILFDCLHAATARMLYYHLTIGGGQDQVLDFLKEHVASSLLAVDDEIKALALLDEKISFFYINNLPKPPGYYFNEARNNHQHLPKVPFNEAFPLIDLFKACHEVFHFLIYQGHQITSGYQELISAQFDRLLNTTYPEEVSEEYVKKLDQMGLIHGDLSSTQQNLSQSNKKTREELLAQRQSLIEEMACDMFALRTVFSWRLDAQQTEQVPSWTPEELFATIFLVAHLIRLVEFYSERALDIKADREIFENQESSHALFFRNIFFHEAAVNLISDLVKYPRLLRGIDFTGREQRLKFDEITFRLAGIDHFLKMFVEFPLNLVLHYTVRSVRAKLEDEQLQNLYKMASEILTREQKIFYTMPIIESFVTQDYFS